MRNRSYPEMRYVLEYIILLYEDQILYILGWKLGIGAYTSVILTV